ncbi:MAG: hypothetical protein JXA28_03055 [Bacteroidetes bacterium]|nr:hypothetical protein [Bacteroidota bacterium]
MIRICLLVFFIATAGPAFLGAQGLTVDPEKVDFGQIPVGSDRCRSILLHNNISVPVALLAVRNPVEPFPVDFPDTIPTDTSALLELCFQARHLGADSAVITIVYHAGTRDSLQIRASAFGWDSLALGIGTTVTGRPGSVVDVPIRVFGDIPASYDVRSYHFRMQFNKTMLYPLSDVTHGASLTAGMGDVAVDMLPDFSVAPAQVEFRVRGTLPLVSPMTDSILVNARFLVLHGNALSSDLTLLSSGFAEGLPRGGIFLKGRFVADSLCYQDLRLVDISDRDADVSISGFPNPMHSTATILFSIRKDMSLRLSVHTMLGEEVALLADGPWSAGTHQLRFDATSLPEGSYLCRLLAGGALRICSLLLLR